jgi:hypothetical protein
MEVQSPMPPMGIDAGGTMTDTLWAVPTAASSSARMNTPSFIGLRKVGGRENHAKRRDFYHLYDLLLASWYLLTNRMQQEILALRQDLHDELASWRPQQPEPDWDAYADRANMICREGGFR